MRNNKILALLAGVSLSAFAASANAQMFKPSVSGELLVELQDNYAFDSDNANSEINDVFLRSELAPKIGITENFYIDGVLVFEEIGQGPAKNPGDDLYFESEGLFAEEVKLNFEYGNFAAWGGKFNPAFGSAWDYGRGIWGEDFAEDYEITEKLGGGIGYTLTDGGEGTHTLAFSTFFNDTSFLSESTITSRGRTRERDGGAGNTESLDSFTISIDGENPGGFQNIKYNLGYRFLAQGDADVGAGFDDEQGVVAGVNYIIPYSDALKFDLLAEDAYITNFGGVDNSDYNYLTLSAKTIINDRWNVTLGYTNRDIDLQGSANDAEDDLFQVSGGYDFQNGLTLETGYRFAEESDVDTDTLGALARYTKEF